VKFYSFLCFVSLFTQKCQWGQTRGWKYIIGFCHKSERYFILKENKIVKVKWEKKRIRAQNPVGMQKKWTEFNFVLFTALPANNHVFSLFSFMWNFCYCYSEGVWLLNCLNLCWKFILMYSFCAIILLAETVNVNIYKPQKNISAECLTNLTKTIMSSYK